MRLIALLAICFGLSSAQAAEDISMTVYAKTGEHSFNMEVANTHETRAKGLQHREHLAEHRGMLFLFPSATNTGFWMKDTLIALDMLFIDENYTIVHIEHNVQPHTLENRTAGQPYVAVAELKGGKAKALGIERADKVRFLLPQGMQVK